MYAYDEEQLKSLRKVEETRAERTGKDLRRLTADEKDALLSSYHPDYIRSAYTNLQVGANAGAPVLKELAALLQGTPRILGEKIDLNKIAYDVDVLIIGGGGAGASAAIEAKHAGANVLMVTKLRIGDANTTMRKAVFRRRIKKTIRLRFTISTLSAAGISRTRKNCSKNW